MRAEARYTIDELADAGRRLGSHHPLLRRRGPPARPRFARPHRRLQRRAPAPLAPGAAPGRSARAARRGPRAPGRPVGRRSARAPGRGGRARPAAPRGLAESVRLRAAGAGASRGGPSHRAGSRHRLGPARRLGRAWPSRPAAYAVAPMLERAAQAVPPATWRRFSLADGVELHVRADAERQQSPLIRRLLAAADVPSADAKDTHSPP